MTDEVLKLALDALEGFIPYLPLKDEAQCNSYDKAITALRLAIDVENMASKSTYKEQLETKDEPVAWEQFYPDIGKPQIAFNAEVVVYVAPQRTWVVLTDEEMRELEKQFEAERVSTSDEEYLVIYPAAYWQWQRAIEAKLKEKNHGN